MHDLFAVSRMHYDMAGYRIAHPPMGVGRLLLAVSAQSTRADSRNRTCPDIGGDDSLLYTWHANPSKEHAT